MQLRVLIANKITSYRNESFSDRIFLPDLTKSRCSPWNYHQLPKVFAGNGWGIKVSTESQLDKALQTAQQNRDQLAFIEVVMDKMDSPKVLL